MDNPYYDRHHFGEPTPTDSIKRRGQLEIAIAKNRKDVWIYSRSGRSITMSCKEAMEMMTILNEALILDALGNV